MRHRMQYGSRFESIDGLRAVAACLVIWLHISEVFVQLVQGTSSQDLWLYNVSSTLDFGRIGVLIFFLISGFLIPSSLKGEPRDGLKKFVIRRFFRLYPLYWLSIPLSLFSMWWLMGRSVDWQTVVFNMTMLQKKFGHADLSGLYWTLRIELYFYAICALLFSFRLLHKEWPIVGAVALIMPIHVLLRIIPGREVSFLAIWTDDVALITLMLVGTLCRRYFDRTLSRFGTAVLAGVFLFFCVGFPLTLGFFYATREQVHGDMIKIILPYPIALMTFAVFILGNIRLKPLSWLGEISYSLYLMHPVVFYTIFWCIIQTGETSWMRQLSLSTYMIAVFVAVIGCSALTFRFIETPMIALGMRLSGKSKTALPTAVFPADASLQPLAYKT